jgi:hypothetical protein
MANLGLSHHMPSIMVCSALLTFFLLGLSWSLHWFAVTPI